MNPCGLKQISIDTGEENGERHPKIELSFSHGADIWPVLEAIVNTAYPDEVLGKWEEEEDFNSQSGRSKTHNLRPCPESAKNG